MQQVPVVQNQNVPQPPPTRVRIAPASIVIFAVVFWGLPLAGFFISQYIDIILLIVIAILFSTFLSPVVERLESLHLPRAVGILVLYVAILAILALIAWLAVPLFVNETQKLLASLPQYLKQVAGPLHKVGINVATSSQHGVNAQNLFTGGGHQATALAGQAVGLVFSVGQLLVGVLSILVMAFLLTVRKDFTADVVNALIPPDYRARWIYVMSRMGDRMGSWVIGQLIITVYYAVAFSLGLTVLNVPNAISVGVITGVLEIIPFVGGFIGAALAVLVAASVNPPLAIWVVVLYLIVTNVEAHILVPLVYGRAVHLHPFLVIVSLLVGAKAFGLIGALVAVPIAAALQVVVENLYIKDVVEAAEKREQRRVRRMPIDLSGLRRIGPRLHRGPHIRAE